MQMTEYERYCLTKNQAEEIPNQSERLFALRCLAVGCVVYYQVPVGQSLIDFLVTNPKVPQSKGTLVEVTLLDKESMHKRRIKKAGKNRKRKTTNRTAKRKERQIESMKESGGRWTILYKDNIAGIVSGLK